MENYVIITGLLEGADLKAVHADANIFVLPSRTDHFPLTIIEACQAGTPMIISDRCAIAPLLEDKVADVITANQENISAAIQVLLHDEARQVRYRSATVELMTDYFSITRVGDVLESAYFQAVNTLPTSVHSESD